MIDNNIKAEAEDYELCEKCLYGTESITTRADVKVQMRTVGSGEMPRYLCQECYELEEKFFGPNMGDVEWIDNGPDQDQ